MTKDEFHNNMRVLQEIVDCYKDPIDDLEWYYNQLDDMNCANYADHDVDMEYTKKRLEKILICPEVNNEDVKFIKSILPDIEKENIERAKRLKEYLNNF